MKKLIYIFAFLPLFACGQSSTGWHNPSSLGNATMTNPENAYSSDGSYTTCAATLPKTTEYKAFGVSVPDGSTIVGISVRIEHYFSSSGSTVRTVKLWNDSDELFTGTKTFTELTSENYTSLGADNDLWGTTWTVSDIDSIYLSISVRTTSSERTFYLDNIQMNVYYTEPAEPSNIFFWHNF